MSSYQVFVTFLTFYSLFVILSTFIVFSSVVIYSLVTLSTHLINNCSTHQKTKTLRPVFSSARPLHQYTFPTQKASHNNHSDMGDRGVAGDFLPELMDTFRSSYYEVQLYESADSARYSPYYEAKWWFGMHECKLQPRLLITSAVRSTITTCRNYFWICHKGISNGMPLCPQKNYTELHGWRCLISK